MSRIRDYLAATLLGIASLTLSATAAELDQYGVAHPWRGAEVGRHTVIDFAASWCAPCMKTLPELDALAKRSPALDFLVVSVDDDVSGRDELVERLALELPVLWDEEYAIANHYEPPAMPTTIILDPEGEVIFTHTGSDAKGWNKFVETVEALQAESPEPQHPQP